MGGRREKGEPAERRGPQREGPAERGEPAVREGALSR